MKSGLNSFALILFIAFLLNTNHIQSNKSELEIKKKNYLSHHATNEIKKLLTLKKNRTLNALNALKSKNKKSKIAVSMSVKNNIAKSQSSLTENNKKAEIMKKEMKERSLSMLKLQNQKTELDNNKKRKDRRLNEVNVLNNKVASQIKSKTEKINTKNSLINPSQNNKNTENKVDQSKSRILNKEKEIQSKTKSNSNKKKRTERKNRNNNRVIIREF